MNEDTPDEAMAAPEPEESLDAEAATGAEDAVEASADADVDVDVDTDAGVDVDAEADMDADEVIEAELVDEDEDGAAEEPAAPPVGAPDAADASAEPAPKRPKRPKREPRAKRPKPAPDEDAPLRPKRTARSVAAVAGRTSGGVVIVAIAAAVAVGSVFIKPEPVTATAPSPIVAAPAPAAQQLVCPGGLLRLADATGAGASTASSIGAPSLAWAGDADVSTRSVTTTNAGTEGSRAAAQIGTVAVPDGATAAPAASGLQQQLGSGDIHGLATASCAAPTTDTWLVAGATTVGRTSLLVVTNPSPVEAVVDLAVYGPNGAVVASGMTGIRLAPDEQRVIPMNGLVVDLDAPVVHVTSSGGRIVAAIEQTITRTLVPGGVDWAGGQTAAGTLVIPGVRVTDAGALVPIDVTETDHADVTPVVRLLAPPAADASGDAASTADAAPVTATVAWIPEGSTLAEALAARDSEQDGGGAEDQGAADGDDDDAPTSAAPAPRSMDVALTPGVTTELPVSGLAAGDYTVVVVAASPVVGAVRTSVIADDAAAAGTGGTEDTGSVTVSGAAPIVDFAWSEPAAALSDEAVVAAPSGASTLASTLWLTNPTDSLVSVTVTTSGRADQTIRLEPGESSSVPMAAGAQLRLTGTTGLSAAIVTSGAGLLAQSPVQPPSPAAGPVRVHL